MLNLQHRILAEIVHHKLYATCFESPRPIIRSGAVDAAVFLASEHDSCDLFLLGQKNWQT